MTDAEFEVQKKRIRALANDWLGPLGLLYWRIHIDFNRDAAMMVNGAWCDETIGKASVQWEYLTATLSFNLNKIAQKDDDDLEYCFVHECCHVLVHEMREWCQTAHLDSDRQEAAMNHEERVVTQMAKAYVWVRRAGAGTLQFNATPIKSSIVASE